MTTAITGTGNKFIDAFGGVITDAQKAMDKLIADAKTGPTEGNPDPLAADDVLFGLTYKGEQFKRDTAAQFVSGAQSGDASTLKGIYDR